MTRAAVALAAFLVALDPADRSIHSGAPAPNDAAGLPPQARWSATDTLQRHAILPPSYDCRQAGTASERAICADDVLAFLDALTAHLYRSRLEYAPEESRTGEVQAQRAFLRERNLCGADTTCMESAYSARLEALGGDDDPTEFMLARGLGEGKPLGEGDRFCGIEYRIHGYTIAFSVYCAGGAFNSVTVTRGN